MIKRVCFGFSHLDLVSRCALLLIFFLFSASTSAQEPRPTTPIQNQETENDITVETDIVILTLTVTDYYGRYVSGLTKENFSILDNKRKQKITFFSDSDAPVSIGILFDVSGSMSGEKIVKAKKALERFMDTSHPRDEYYLIAFNKRVQILADRIRDGEAILNKFTMVNPKHNTALYDACYLGIERVSQGTHQKKALLIISDGQDNASRYNFKEVVRLVKESDVVIYSIGIIDESDSASSMGVQGQAFLDELSNVTGGKSFYPSTGVEMNEIFERIALELRHQYLIGYTPDKFQPDGKWHKVKVKITPPRGLPRLTVRNRKGYYANPKTNFR